MLIKSIAHAFLFRQLENRKPDDGGAFLRKYAAQRTLFKFFSRGFSYIQKNGAGKHMRKYRNKLNDPENLLVLLESNSIN